MNDLKASIIVTSYNQAKTLRLLFPSLERQTEKNFEVVIADDGSSDETPQLCAEQKNLNLHFVTQPDLGYRKAKILNAAIRQTRSNYLIFLDGDVILERHFLEDHLKLRKQGHFVCGRRVDMGLQFSEALKPSQVSEGFFDGFNWSLFSSCLRKDSTDFNRSLRVTSPILRKIFKYDKPIDILGSNFGAWKADLIAVNGFNEALESYWGEDGDLYVRLRNSGKLAIGAKAICVQFHVFHERRTPTQEHVDSFYRLLKDESYKWASKGYEHGARS